MRLPAVLILLLAAGVAAAAAWHFLGAPSVTVEEEDDAPFRASAPGELGGPSDVAARPGPEVVELPPDREVRRVAVLAAGAVLPPHGAADPATLDALHETRVEGDPVALSGEELIERAGRVTLVRFGTEADQRAIERLGPDPDWPEDDGLPLAEVLEHWRRVGFVVEMRGPYLVVLRHDE